jgi:hypothetical protein
MKRAFEEKEVLKEEKALKQKRRGKVGESDCRAYRAAA